jgi:5'-nucleotidase
MKILLSNDDGFSSPGIRILFEELKKKGHEVILVAPASDRSTVGHSLTLHKPLRIKENGPGDYQVSGSPADCIYVATRQILDEKPDLVISGINNGANLGNDIFYSGTVAAAREGLLYGIPSMAISLARGIPGGGSSHGWDAAEKFVKKSLQGLIEANIWSVGHLINVNIPEVAPDEIKGIKLTVQGKRNYSNSVQERTDPRGKKYYWVGGNYVGFDNIEFSDCVAVNDGFVSVTPLKIDTTDYQGFESFRIIENVKI